MKPILEIHNVSKLFRIRNAQKADTLREQLSINYLFSSSQRNKTDFWALKDISFTVMPGETLGIIGKNGAGKSTLLKILSRITSPTSGRILARGRMASLLEVGTGFHPELTGRENIYLNGAILGMRKHEIRAKIDAIIDFSGTEQFIETPLKHFSSGMQLRLAFAVAAFLDPEILVVDEVLAVGDAQFQKKCIAKMKEVSTSGRTILFVSHHLPALKSLCRTSLLLHQGNLIYQGLTEDVLLKYEKLSQEQNIRSRHGTGEVQLVELNINTDRNNSENINPVHKKSISFELIVEAYASKDNVSVALGFNSSTGQRISSAWSAFNGDTYNLSKGKHIFTIEIPSLRLIPGTYEIITYIESKGTVLDETLGVVTIVVGFDPESIQIFPQEAQGIYVEDYYISHKIV
jgi:lipopolysaccharide transport system ATP-binding protein